MAFRCRKILSVRTAGVVGQSKFVGLACSTSQNGENIMLHIACITIAVVRLSSILLEGELRARAIPALPAKIARNVETHLGMDGG